MAEGSRIFLGVLSIWIAACAAAELLTWLFP